MARKWPEEDIRGATMRLRTVCPVLLPARLSLPIRLTAARTGISGLGLRFRIARLEEEAEEIIAVAARDLDNGRGLARDEAALRLVAQHRDEFGAIVGLAAQRLVGDDDRGSRRCGRRDAREYL